ncbi:MAG: PadR family transcriptional regulator [Candidatus Aenigmarchaeota archaeon]|nr:PadR family transcriptional regulator [Candidatus Aenigmarchaeota archaeon]
MKKDESFMTNLTKFYMLTLLREEPRHGYDIMKELGARLGKKPSAGQIYPLLKKMQGLGYVTRSADGKKKTYKLTAEGKAFAMNMMDRFSRILDASVRQRLVKCACCGCEVYSGSVRQRLGSRTFSFCCTSCAAGFDGR